MIGSGGQSWSSYWSSRFPYFALPATGVSLIVGQSVTIYGDELINLPIDGDLTITYTCNIGSQSGNNYIINPITANIGNHSLRIVFVSNGITREDKTITLSVYALAPAMDKKILMLGDSLVALGGAEIAYGLTTAVPGAITWLGLQNVDNGAPYGDIDHEGLVGGDWISYSAWVGSPFFKAGVLNVPAYFADNSIATPDYVIIRCGVNAALTYCDNQNAGYGMSALVLANDIVGSAKTLIDAFLAFNAGLKIIIGLPTICENSGAGWNAVYDETRYIQDKYIEILHRIQEALSTTYANKVYNARVDCSYESIFLNSDDGYPKMGGVHTDSVHLSISGYLQLGQGLSMTLNRVFAEDFLRDGETTAWYDSQDLTTITKDAGTGEVSLWKDKLLSGNDLVQAVATRYPIWSTAGITFDGLNDYLQGTFTLEQPEQIYVVLKQLTFANSSRIFDGIGGNNGTLSQYNAGVPPALSVYCGTAWSTTNTNLDINILGIIRILFNGAGSKLQINATAATTGNFGDLDMGGLTLGGRGDIPTIGNSNFIISEMIIRKVADSAGNEAAIYAYLKAKYGL
jgi:hypothetical protein